MVVTVLTPSQQCAGRATCDASQAGDEQSQTVFLLAGGASRGASGCWRDGPSPARCFAWCPMVGLHRDYLPP